jgi:hypothetical protein
VGVLFTKLCHLKDKDEKKIIVLLEKTGNKIKVWMNKGREELDEVEYTK